MKHPSRYKRENSARFEREKQINEKFALTFSRFYWDERRKTSKNTNNSNANETNLM